MNFIHTSLQEIDKSLRAHGSQLIVRYGNPVDEVLKVAQAIGAHSVFAASDYEPYAQKRDATVRSLLNELGIRFESVKDSVIREGGEVMTQAGTPHRVYSPYARTWRSLLKEQDIEEAIVNLQMLVSIPLLNSFENGALCHPWELSDIGFHPSEIGITAGEASGISQLDGFAEKIQSYAQNRDFPALDATSHLSVHLRFGTVSVRQAMRLALSFGPSGDKWLAELIWREFYQDLLFHHPEVAQQTFQPQYRNLEYSGSEEFYHAWCVGKTGYPLVDAAMRCFNETGWMHNRLRMVVGSFLTKDLLVDYRRGESYFADGLLDFELASNNGGWQWVASVGADAQPYFRIFNPILQSRKFDPDGAFIREWVPELRDLDNKSIHFPSDLNEFELTSAGVYLGQNYPHPMVDHHTQKDLAVALLSQAAKNV